MGNGDTLIGQGETVIEPQFNAAQQFREEMAGVKVGDHMGFIDISGKIAVRPEYDFVYPFADGIGIGCVGEPKNDLKAFELFSKEPHIRQLYLDKHGGVLHESMVSGSAINGLEGVRIEPTIEPRGGSTQYSNTSFENGLALTLVGSKYGYMDKTFKLVIPAQYDFAYRFSQDRALVYDASSKRLGFIDKNGLGVTGFKFEQASDFNEDLAVVQEPGILNPFRLFGYIDRNGAYRIWSLFSSCETFSLWTCSGRPVHRFALVNSAPSIRENMTVPLGREFETRSLLFKSGEVLRRRNFGKRIWAQIHAFFRRPDQNSPIQLMTRGGWRRLFACAQK